MNVLEIYVTWMVRLRLISNEFSLFSAFMMMSQSRLALFLVTISYLVMPILALSVNTRDGSKHVT